MKTQLPVIPEHVPTHDNTMFRAYTRCPRLYAVYHVLGRTRRGTKDTPLRFGSLVHLGLETYYSNLQEGKNVAEALVDALEVMKASKYKDPIDDFRTKARAMHDLKQYVINYKGDQNWKLLLTETAFDIEDDEGYRYGGRKDLTVETTGRLFPVDHKTTSRFTKYYYDNYKMDPQMHGYFWAAWQLTGELPAGVIINVIILHKGQTKFDRKPVLFNKAHIERWRERNIIFYNEIGKLREQDPDGSQWDNQDIWTPRYENCVDRYGRCPMFQVCHAPPKNAQFHLDAHFVEGRWDFTNVDDE